MPDNKYNGFHVVETVLVVLTFGFILSLFGYACFRCLEIRLRLLPLVWRFGPPRQPFSRGRGSGGWSYYQCRGSCQHPLTNARAVLTCRSCVQSSPKSFVILSSGRLRLASEPSTSITIRWKPSSPSRIAMRSARPPRLPLVMARNLPTALVRVASLS